jgi:hypothetical protein
MSNFIDRTPGIVTSNGNEASASKSLLQPIVDKKGTLGAVTVPASDWPASGLLSPPAPFWGISHERSTTGCGVARDDFCPLPLQASRTKDTAMPRESLSKLEPIPLRLDSMCRIAKLHAFTANCFALDSVIVQ